MDNKILYLKGGAKKDQWGNIDLSLKPAQLMKILEFQNKKRVEAGVAETDFLRLRIKERKEPGDYGDTHYATWSLWIPEPKEGQKAAPKAAAKAAQKPPVDEDDDLPF